MISKRMPMNSAKKSSFAGLVKYITNGQGKSERVGEVQITNCQSDDVRWAIGEVLATQKQNTRAEGDRTYHLLISFPPSEKPSADVLSDIEQRICAAMGYGEHQRISAVHNDTDSLHIHVAINKIHPERHTMHEPYRDFKTRSEMCAKLEIEYGLERVSHVGRKSQSESRATDMEQHAGVESLLSWVRRECLEQIQGAESWKELHQALSENGLQLRERGNGLVIEDQSGLMVKASSVARELSKNKLEERFGAFESTSNQRQHKSTQGKPAFKKPGIGKVGQKPPAPNRNGLRNLSQLDSIQIDSGKRYEKKPLGSRMDTTELYARFKGEQAALSHIRSKALAVARGNKVRQVEDAKRLARFKRASIKVMGGSALNKKMLYAMTSKTLMEQIQTIHADHKKVVEEVNSQNKSRVWADWLQAKALEGDQQALQALRARKSSGGLKGQTFAAKEQPAPQKPTETPASPITGFSQEEARRQGAFLEDALLESDAVVSAIQLLERDHITKEGTVIYRAGASAIRDDGNKLQLSRGTTQDGIETALRMAVARYGEQITVTGSDQFKELVAQTAVARNLPIKFDDVALEQRRQHLQQTLSKENTNVRTERTERTNRGRTDSSGDGRNGRRAARNERDTGTSTGTTGVNRGSGDGRSASGAAAGAGVHGAGRSSGPAAAGKRSVALRSTAGTAKPGIARVGRKPPPEGQNRLRTLSKLGVVQLAYRSEVLLPGHVPGVVEHQGTKPNNEMRRDLSGGGITPSSPMSGPQAARKYISEREDKRAKGFDIPKHRLYNQSDDGPATFAGVRQIEGQSMALLKRGEEVLVLPVNEATARRMKRMKLGDQVTATANGATKSKGRSR